jgi:hypothetical protein
MIAQIAVTFAFDASDIADIFTSDLAGILIGIGKFIFTPLFNVPSSSTIRNTHGSKSQRCCVARSVICVKCVPLTEPLEACQWDIYPFTPSGTVYIACRATLKPA